MVMECSERLSATVVNLCQYEKLKCTSPVVNGSKYCSKHLNSHQCSHVRGGTQCKNRIAGSEQRTLCTTHLQARASRKRRRTEAPAHKDIVNKTPPLALHVFRIMTQERQRLKFKPNMFKRPLEHLKWVMKKEKLDCNPIYPSGMESDCNQHDTPHNSVTLDEDIPVQENEMSDITTRSVYLSKVEEQVQQRVHSLVYQVNTYRRAQQKLPERTKALTEAARSNINKTTHLLNGKDKSSSKDRCECQFPNPAARYLCCVCNKRALPFTKYCIHHIIQDNQQVLFSKCGTVMSHTVDSCPEPTFSSTGRPCTFHSILERFGVTESQDIETESSSSESDGEDATSIEPQSVPPSPDMGRKDPPLENHKLPSLPPPALDIEMDMALPSDTILETTLLPEEPDIPLASRFLEPNNAFYGNKRIRPKDEDLQARMSQFMKIQGMPPPGYFPYSYNYGGPENFIPAGYKLYYNKEGEPIYGYHDNKQHEYQKFIAARQHSTSGSEGSRPTTPVVNHTEMMAHYYQQQQQQQQRFSYPANSPVPATPEPKKEPSPTVKKKQKKKKESKAEESAKKQSSETTSAVTPQQIQNPYNNSQDGSGSPNSAASPATMALLKSKLGEPKKDDTPPPPEPPEQKPKPKKNSTPNNGSKGASPKTPASKQPEFVMMPGHHPAMMNQHFQMQAGQPNFYQYQQHMYPGYPQPYYLQMYMQPGMVGMQPGGQPGPPKSKPSEPPTSTAEKPQTNGPTTKESKTKTPDPPVSSSSSDTTTTTAAAAVGSEAAQLNEYQKYTQQQRQRQQMIAAQSQVIQGQYPYPQQFQYYSPFPNQHPPTSSPKPEKKRKKPAPKDRSDKETSQKKKPSLSSPCNKDTPLSSLQSLLSTASSGRLPPETVLSDTEPAKVPSKPRSKKSSTKEESESAPSQHLPSHMANFPNNYTYYQGYGPVPGGPVLMTPMKGLVNGAGGPLYFRVDESMEIGHDNKPVLINDAVLARNRPSSHLMKDPGWRERYMNPKKTSNNSDKSRNKPKVNSSPGRSPQKAQHRNLIFHNTEIGTISDKLAKQQKNAEQRSSHRAMCTKSKTPDSGETNNNNNNNSLPNKKSSLPNNNTNNVSNNIENNVYRSSEKGPDKLPVYIPDKRPIKTSDNSNPIPINSQPEGVT